jgi:hypothetical protein
VKTADALSLLIALEQRVARIYFRFFRIFRDDPLASRCWWDLARDEYGHAGLLTMLRELVAPDLECGEIGGRLWALVEMVERCERQAEQVDSLARALELAIRLETSELDALGHRIVQSLEADLPEGAAHSFSTLSTHYRRLAEAADGVSDPKLRQRLESMLGSSHVP